MRRWQRLLMVRSSRPVTAPALYLSCRDGIGWSLSSRSWLPAVMWVVKQRWRDPVVAICWDRRHKCAYSLPFITLEGCFRHEATGPKVENLRIVAVKGETTGEVLCGCADKPEFPAVRARRGRSAETSERRCLFQSSCIWTHQLQLLVWVVLPLISQSGWERSGLFHSIIRASNPPRDSAVQTTYKPLIHQCD